MKNSTWHNIVIHRTCTTLSQYQLHCRKLTCKEERRNSTRHSKPNLEINKNFLQLSNTFLPRRCIGKVNPRILLTHSLGSTLNDRPSDRTTQCTMIILTGGIPYSCSYYWKREFFNSQYLISSMLSSLRIGATSSSFVRVLASRFSTMNPMVEAQRVEEIRNVLNSVWNYSLQSDY